MGVGSGSLPGLISRANAVPALGFKPGLDVGKWQAELRARLRSILALPAAAAGPLEARVERHRETAQYTMDRIRFTAEPGEVVPGWLLKPKSARGSMPVMICLQGHSPGMHISIGEARNESERKSIAGGRDPRTGRPLSCTGCHLPHTADQPSLLSHEPRRELCVQCHDPSMMSPKER